MRFTVVEVGTDKPVNVHQAFAVFTHKSSKREVIYVAELELTEKSKTVYKWETDLTKAGTTEFEQMSGEYELRMVVGAATVENPIDWVVVCL